MGNLGNPQPATTQFAAEVEMGRQGRMREKHERKGRDVCRHLDGQLRSSQTRSTQGQ
jgi:hypothetical protein